MAENQNKLRGGKSKAPVIWTLVIMGLIGFLFILYVSYVYLGYVRTNNITEPGYEDIAAVFNMLFKPESFALPLTFDVIKDVLVMQVKDIWWVYGGIAVMIFLIVTSKKPNDFRGMEYGSARWADKYEEQQFTDDTGIPCGDNFYITVDNPNHKFYETHNLNETVIGGSGAGKSFRKIKPDIIQMTGSYVVTDPSGELYRDTANFLRKNGYKVRVLNLNNINLTNTYNPFVYMNEMQDVLEVADLFMKNSAGDGEKEDFWSGAAQDLLVMIMVYLFKNEDETKSFGRVLRLINSINYTSEGKIDENCELAQCVKRHMEKEENRYDAVAVNWGSVKGVAQETMSSIAKTMSVRLRLWSVEDVDILTDKDEMDFDDIGVHRTAIFLIIPGASQTYRAVANIFYSQLFKRLMYIAELKYNNRLPLLVSCELDEFANVGRIPNFKETLAIVRKYNIRLCMVLQSLSQLKSLYEKDWNGIINNCSILTLLGTTDSETCEEISKRLGETTVRIDTKSYNRGNQGGGSDSETYIARRLLKPDEIPKALKKGSRGKCIVFVDEFSPFFLSKFDTLKHPKIDEIGSFKGKNQVNNANLTADFSAVNEKRKKEYAENRRKAHLISEALAAGNYEMPISTEQQQDMAADDIVKRFYNDTEHEVSVYNSDTIDDLEEMNLNGRT